RRSGLIQFAEEGLFPEVESLATRMKGLARCGEEVFYSVFRYVLNEPIPTSSPRGTRVAYELPIVLMRGGSTDDFVSSVRRVRDAAGARNAVDRGCRPRRSASGERRAGMARRRHEHTVRDHPRRQRRALLRQRRRSTARRCRQGRRPRVRARHRGDRRGAARRPGPRPPPNPPHNPRGTDARSVGSADAGPAPASEIAAAPKPSKPATAATEPAVVPASRSASESYWYYCPSSRAYYPKVPSCSEAWIKVPPR